MSNLEWGAQAVAEELHSTGLRVLQGRNFTQRAST